MPQRRGTKWGVRGVEDLPVIMVVEDDQLVQTMVEAALSDGGFEPAIAASGEEAVTLLKGGTKYRALVTDINLLGRMDGWLGGREARQRDRPGISHRLYDRRERRRLWFTGCPQQHSFDQAVRSGPTGHRRFPASQCREADDVRPASPNKCS